MFTFTAPLWGEGFVFKVVSKRVGEVFFFCGWKTLICLLFTSCLFKETKSIFGYLLGLFLLGEGDLRGDLPPVFFPVVVYGLGACCT
jgi:hypothetical protein